jgi:hypothetical protein
MVVMRRWPGRRVPARPVLQYYEPLRFSPPIRIREHAAVMRIPDARYAAPRTPAGKPPTLRETSQQQRLGFRLRTMSSQMVWVRLQRVRCSATAVSLVSFKPGVWHGRILGVLTADRYPLYRVPTAVLPPYSMTDTLAATRLALGRVVEDRLRHVEAPAGTAMCVIAVVGDAPCQCFSPGGNQTTSPGRISSIGPSQRWASPAPAVTIRV